MFCGLDSMIFEVAACFACATVSSVRCACCIFGYFDLPIMASGFD